MRASRLVSLLLVLQTRGGLTAAELAGELEVSVRTVYRDVEALAEAGVPIFAERGPHGGVRLVEGYRTRLTGLTAEEAQALFLSGLPGPAAELGLGTVVAAARLKMLAALPPELRARASRIAERFHLDAPGWSQAAEDLPHLETLAAAVWETRRVRVRYRRGGRTETRLLEPLGLVLKAGIWYLVARRDDAYRTYRISRVVEASTTGERFERPAGFDLAAHWAASIDAYERERRGRRSLPVTLRIQPEAMDRLEEAVGREAMHAARRQRIVDPEGRVGLRLRLDPEWAFTDLLRLGADVEVLEPLDLRERLQRTGRAIYRRYASQRSTAARATSGRATSGRATSGRATSGRGAPTRGTRVAPDTAATTRPTSVANDQVGR